MSKDIMDISQQQVQQQQVQQPAQPAQQQAQQQPQAQQPQEPRQIPERHMLERVDAAATLESSANTEAARVLQGLESRTRAIIQKYQAALREMEVRFEIIDQDLSLKKNRNPIHHVESRIKTPSSIFEKLGRYGKEVTLENMERFIMDIAGLRLICSYVQDVYSLLELLERQDDLEIVAVKDYIANPKPNGYRSLHVIVRVPVYFLDAKQMIPVEVQIRTIAMDFWASLEHDLKYKAISEVAGIDSYDELKDCSRIIEDVEKRMAILANALEVNETSL